MKYCVSLRTLKGLGPRSAVKAEKNTGNAVQSLVYFNKVLNVEKKFDFMTQ